jgi:4-hydroxythreonine-4-phosphate dehydrogenase
MGESRPLVGITAGDPAGVGPEIVVKALWSPAPYAEVRPVVYADGCVLAAAAAGKGLLLREIASPAEARGMHGTIDYLDPHTLSEPVAPGKISAAGGRAGFACLARAIDDALAGLIDAVATAPLNKESLRAAEVPYLDHTAALADLAALSRPMTLFLVQNLKIFFLTRHIPLSAVPAAVNAGDLLAAVPSCLAYLRQLGAGDPTLAVAALNPHGGEQGLFGTEERDVIAPAVAEAQRRGHRVVGPVPADAVFHQALTGRYDGVLSLYHDQGHIAAKTLDFHGTVSLTMGLRFLRTSVDHGTAFDIAGRGIAEAGGMVAAIRAAGRYALGVKARPIT